MKVNRKTNSKRLFSMLLALMMCLTMLPTTAWAVGELTEPLNFTSATDNEGEGYRWTAESKTLTLDGLTLNVTTGDGITLPANSKIVLSGTNTVNAGGDLIDCAGNLEISGEGSLTGEVTTVSDNYAGIRTNGGSLTITDSKLDLTINPQYSTAPTITTKNTANTAGGSISLCGKADVTAKSKSSDKGWGLCSGAYGSSGNITIDTDASFSVEELHLAIYAGAGAVVTINGTLDSSACPSESTLCANLLTSNTLTINGTVKMREGQSIYLVKGSVVLGENSDVNELIIVTTSDDYYEAYVFSNTALEEETTIESFSKKLNGYKYIYVDDDASLTIPEGKTLIMKSMKGNGIDGPVVNNGTLELPEGTTADVIKTMNLTGNGLVKSGGKTIYTVTFDANGGTGTMHHDVIDASGTYTLPANGFTEPEGKQFKGWARSEDGTVISETTITVEANTTLYAIWEDVPAYAVTVNNGTGDGNYAAGATVTITADKAPSGKEFDKWTVVSGEVSLANETSETTTFEMPENAVEVTATYTVAPSIATSSNATKATDLIIKKKPAKTEYKLKEDFNPAGLVVEVVETTTTASASNAGKKRTLTEDEYDLDTIEFDPETPGIYTIYVVYTFTNESGDEELLKKSFTVEVLDEELDTEETYVYEIKIQKRPNKTSYNIGEAIDLSGIVVVAKQKGIDSGKKKDDCILTSDDYAVEYDFSTYGTRKVTIIYYDGGKEEDKTLRASFNVKVLRPYNSSSDDDDDDTTTTTSYSASSWTKTETNNWQYRKEDGSLARNQWIRIVENGKDVWYWFDTTANMMNGWINDLSDGHRYYLDPSSGRMATGWYFIDGVWYYFNEAVSQDSGWYYDGEKKDWCYIEKGQKPYGALLEDVKREN